MLNPDSVAVIGASLKEGKVGYAVIQNLIQGKFKGKLVPVNPKLETYEGIPCFPNLVSHKEPVDVAVIAVPTPAVKPAVQDALDAHAKSIIVITAGFKETGPEGAALEEEIGKMCKSHGVRMLGPNCVGLINAHHKFNASFATQMPTPGGISVVSQSGALCTAILDWAAGRHLGLAKLISIGNKADVDETDLLQALAHDDETKVIVAYLESIESGSNFIKIAEEVSALKPVVVFKAGTTKAGAKAASSHTGSLAGADIAYGAAFKRAGVIRADSFDAMTDFATALAMQNPPQGNRVAIVTNAGGPGIMAADAMEKAGLTVQPLEAKTAEALKKDLPAAASVGNPIDVLGDAGPDRYVRAINAAQDDPSVDSIMVMLSPQAMTRPADVALAAASCARGDKPVLACFLGGEDVMPGRDQLVASGLPDFTSPEKAASALKAMWEYSAWKNRPPRIITRFPVNRRRVERIIHRHLRMERLQVGEIDAKKIFEAYDFKIPEGKLATTSEEAIEIANRIGMPVVMKIVSPDIIHKSDMGGVKLNLSTPSEVRDAFDLMMLRISQRAPEAKIDGVYIEKMGQKGVEVILGMTRDPQFGPMLMFGLGGIFVEVMKDVSFYLAPITADEAMQMLKGTRSYSLLTGVRGRAGVNIEAIAKGLQRISQLVTDFPHIMELDINPFILSPDSDASLVADGRITLRDFRQQKRNSNA